MNIVESTKNLMIGTGAQAVLWLLFGLSAASLGLIFERAVAFRLRRGSVPELRLALLEGLRSGGLGEARARLDRSRHPAARVALRGLDSGDGEAPLPKQAEEAMGAELVAQRDALDSGLGALATLGSNAPFVGLFGTVVGIVGAFDVLGRGPAAGQAGGASAGLVMASVGEALVATAVGIGVAIPAVVAYNYFSRQSKAALAGAEILARELLSYLEGAARGR
ncbi:MAG TPA: MotA/TolQ/ExbB proton channel family protein [Polyangiaceae bacterium]|nr:MotA/TolQ/ExbB proton channel family protein [Polyangiaceae bacterium]